MEKEIFKNYYVNDLGELFSTKKSNKAKLAPFTTKKGYLRIELNAKKYFVHRLVALAFIPNPDNKPFVNHINGVKIDNRPINLEWVTNQENKKHAALNGLTAKGIDNGQSKLLECQIHQIRLDTRSLRVIAKDYNVDKSIIGDIKNRTSWKHI
jgi:hypothetical protein